MNLIKKKQRLVIFGEGADAIITTKVIGSHPSFKNPDNNVEIYLIYGNKNIEDEKSKKPFKADSPFGGLSFGFKFLFDP